MVTGRKRFVQRSRMRELIAAIDEFIEERGEMGRLTRPLQLFEDALEEQRSELLGDNESAQEKLEFNRRQKRTVHDADHELSTLENAMDHRTSKYCIVPYHPDFG